MKMTLQTMQQKFLSYLLEPKEQMANLVQDAGQDTATQRLEIYSQGYRLRLEEALQENYPALHTLLGDHEFHRLCFDYITKYPSHHFSIRFFGHNMASYITNNDTIENQSVLNEMALFEWTLREVFDARSNAVLSEKSLAAIAVEDWPNIWLLPNSTLRFLNLSWNVPQIWKLIDENQPPQAPTKNDHPLTWILWRKGLQTYFRSLEVDEAWSLTTMLEGGTFDDICTGLTEWLDEGNIPLRAAGFLKRWVQDELISDYALRH